jgi:CelD/BcsL family acetyltransferase involved in cellulose biosynthesis
LRYDILESGAEVELLAKDWEELRMACGGSIFTSHAFTQAWLREFSDIAVPKVITAWENGQLVGVAPLAVWERKAVGMRMRILSLIGSAGSTQEFHELGFLSEKERTDVTEGLIDHAGRVRWDILMMRDMTDNESNHFLLASVAKRWKAGRVSKEVCPCITVPEGDDVLADLGSRTRRRLRSHLRILEADKRIEFRQILDAEGAERAMGTFAELHQARWKDKGGSIFADKRQTRLLIEEARLAMSSRSGCVCEVVIDNKIAAQQLILYDGEYGRAHRMSINPEFMEYHPGYLVVYGAMLDIKKRDLKLLDMGKGAEEYKYRLGAKDRYLIGMQAVRGRMALATKLSGLPGVKQVATRTGLKDKALRGIYNE